MTDEVEPDVNEVIQQIYAMHFMVQRHATYCHERPPIFIKHRMRSMNRMMKSVIGIASSIEHFESNSNIKLLLFHLEDVSTCFKNIEDHYADYYEAQDDVQED